MQYKEATVIQVRQWLMTYTRHCQHLFWLYCSIRGLQEDSPVLVGETMTQVFLVDASRDIEGNELVYDKVPWSMIHNHELQFYLTPPDNGWDVVYVNSHMYLSTPNLLFGVTPEHPWTNGFLLAQLEWIISTLGDDRANLAFDQVKADLAKGDIEVRVKAQLFTVSSYNQVLWPNCEAPNLKLKMVTRLGESVRIEGFRHADHCTSYR